MRCHRSDESLVILRDASRTGEQPIRFHVNKHWPISEQRGNVWLPALFLHTKGSGLRVRGIFLLLSTTELKLLLFLQVPEDRTSANNPSKCGLPRLLGGDCNEVRICFRSLQQSERGFQTDVIFQRIPNFTASTSSAMLVARFEDFLWNFVPSFGWFGWKAGRTSWHVALDKNLTTRKELRKLGSVLFQVSHRRASHSGDLEDCRPREKSCFLVFKCVQFCRSACRGGGGGGDDSFSNTTL